MMNCIPNDPWKRILDFVTLVNTLIFQFLLHFHINISLASHISSIFDPISARIYQYLCLESPALSLSIFFSAYRKDLRRC